jgi:hypothetical protein
MTDFQPVHTAIRTYLQTTYVIAAFLIQDQVRGYKKGRRQNYVKYLETNLSNPKPCVRWRGTLKGAAHESEWPTSTESLGASPFERNLSIDTTFRRIFRCVVPLNKLNI